MANLTNREWICIVCVCYSALLLSTSQALENTYPIINSQEFQLKLNPAHWNTSSLRGISEFGYMQITLASLEPKLENWERIQYYREQKHYRLGDCGLNETKVALRLRHWKEPRELEMHSIDVKVNPRGLSRHDAFLEPRPSPAEDYKDRAKQDVEEDIHPCKPRDFARTTKVFFGKDEETPKLVTCGDVRAIFPNATLESHDDLPLPNPRRIITYLVDYKYTREDGSRIRIEFTLDYRSEEDAHEANNLMEGEFSITLFAANDGFSYPLDPQLQAATEEAIELLFTHYGSPGDCEPTKEDILEEILEVDWPQVLFFCNLFIGLFGFYWIIRKKIHL